LQKSLGDSYPKPVYIPQRDLQNINEVLSDAPCLSCPQSLEPKCDIEGCPKLTAWLIGEQIK